MATNKKVRNATPKEYNGIHFKSTIETMVYRTLLEHGFDPQYEKVKYILWEGIRPTVPFYTRKGKNNEPNMKKMINITWTPDFYMEYNGLKIIIEVKGKSNDVFPYKLKMFRKLLEGYKDKEKYLIFEIFTKTQLLQAIEVIKQYATGRQNEEPSSSLT